MAASTFIPAGPRPGGRALAARAAARSAPRGAGLAPVVPLPVRARDEVAARGGDAAGSEAVATVALRLVPATPRRTPSMRAQRVVAALLAVAVLIGAGVGVATTVLAAPAEPAVLGHVVLQPGETLWDIAVRSAPAGTDPRRQLDALRRVNGFGPGALDAWTVVLIPAT